MGQSFTYRPASKVKTLITGCGVSLPYKPLKGLKPPKVEQFKGLWDTGATGTVISKNVASKLGLLPVSKAIVHHANGQSVVNVYVVNIYLPNKVAVSTLRVSEGVLSGFDVLIGMDIISSGDFALTNANNKTVFSFKIPSTEEIDFLNPTTLPTRNEKKKPILNPVKPARNSKCPCGSDKKYKSCCGKAA